MSNVLQAVERDGEHELGKIRRSATPRSSHAELPPRPAEYDLLQEIDRATRGRISNLLPIRAFRMATSPFAFFRGTAAVMADDLAATPVSGIMTQISGDAHCANFGAFATPERNLIFDVRDFDETLPGPWEWDLKRLVASLVLAGRDVDLDDDEIEPALYNAAGTYRKKMREFAQMSSLDVWYARVDVNVMLDEAGSKSLRAQRRTYVEGIGRRTIQHAYDSMVENVDGKSRFVDELPLIYHESDPPFFDIEQVVNSYSRSLPHEIGRLFGRFRLEDWAVKVVGVGSIGTRCAVALFMAGSGDPLVLQIKEAGESALERHLKPSEFSNAGKRVVVGQRSMQAASDLFLGWTRARDGRAYYVRQLRDMKGVPDLEEMGDDSLKEFARFCGWTLAGAHARSGVAARIAGYLGSGDVFDEAIVRFGYAYAARAKADYDVFRRAIDSGTIAARAVE